MPLEFNPNYAKVGDPVAVFIRHSAPSMGYTIVKITPTKRITIQRDGSEHTMTFDCNGNEFPAKRFNSVYIRLDIENVVKEQDKKKAMTDLTNELSLIRSDNQQLVGMRVNTSYQYTAENYRDIISRMRSALDELSSRVTMFEEM